MIIDTYPQPATVTDIQELTPQIKRFRFVFDDKEVRNNFTWKPGQFLEVSVLGYGEGAFGIANSPLDNSYIEVSINKVGLLTSAIHNLKKGDKVYLRGAFGNGFDLDYLRNKNIIFVAGGCGLPPLRSVFEYVHDRRDEFKDIFILIGARTPQDLLFVDEYGHWEDFANVLITVDEPGEQDWRGHTGVITVLFDKVKLPIEDTVSLVCGPPIMYKFVIQKLIELNMREQDILVSLERNMKCGVGLCQHCTVGKRYVCKDGPVFSYAETKDMFDKGHDEEGGEHSLCTAI